MTSAEVEALLGPPIEEFVISRDGKEVNWMYTYPKNVIDLSFWRSWVLVKNGTVIKVISEDCN